MRRTLSLSLIALPLCACGSVKDAVRGPVLDPTRVPTGMTTTAEAIPHRASANDSQPASIAVAAASHASPAPSPASANSLWRSGARAFFIDQRASRVGDILTVLIDIDDSADLSNASGATRTASSTTGIPHLFGLEALLGKVAPAAFDPTNLISTGSSSTSQGTGSVARKEKISLTVAAVVTQVLPNGNLVISGSQEVKTNEDLRELTVGGIVRPEDISSANTIRHTQIAEARINYGGRGDQMRVQKTPVGQSLLQVVNPF